jgi:hypothetical protein
MKNVVPHGWERNGKTECGFAHPCGCLPIHGMIDVFFGMVDGDTLVDGET